MKPGRMRHRVTLQRREYIRNAEGEAIQSYVDDATVWAEITPVSGREYIASQQVNAEITTRIVIRWYEGVEATHRVRHQTRFDSPNSYDYYDVVSALADPVVGRRWITLLCVRRDSEGFRSGQ